LGIDTLIANILVIIIIIILLIIIDSCRLATSDAELQQLVNRQDRVSRKYSLLINVDKIKLMASDCIA